MQDTVLNTGIRVPGNSPSVKPPGWSGHAASMCARAFKKPGSGYAGSQGDPMKIQFKKGVLEICVLSVLAHKDCYGYELVNEISKRIDISEGTIYPLLRRLKDEG